MAPETATAATAAAGAACNAVQRDDVDVVLVCHILLLLSMCLLCLGEAVKEAVDDDGEEKAAAPGVRHRKSTNSIRKGRQPSIDLESSLLDCCRLLECRCRCCDAIVFWFFCSPITIVLGCDRSPVIDGESSLWKCIRELELFLTKLGLMSVMCCATQLSSATR
jgi:hypothetical protein